MTMVMELLQQKKHHCIESTTMRSSSTVTRRKLSFAPTDSTIDSLSFSKSSSQDGGEASSWPPTTDNSNNDSSSPRNDVSMKPSRGLSCRQEQQQSWYNCITSSNSKTPKKRSKYGFWWWCSRRLTQWSTPLQYSVVTQGLLFLFLCGICIIYILSRSLFLPPSPSFHSYHNIHHHHKDHHQHDRDEAQHSHLHHHHEYFRTATTTTTIDSITRSNKHNINAMTASSLISTLYTYPKSLYLYSDKVLTSSSLPYSSSAVVAPTKPMIHALDWYEPDFGGLHIRMLVVDDALLRHDEESNNQYDSHGPRRPLYYNDRYYKDVYHSDDDVEMRGETRSNNNNNNIDEFNYYAFDDDAKRDPFRHRRYQTTTTGQMSDTDTIQNKTCRRVSWHRDMQLNCLNFHEFDFANHILQGSSKYIGGGAFRAVFRVSDDETYDDDHGVTTSRDPTVATTDRFVLKECGMGEEHQLGHEDMESMRMDGAVGAALQPHPLFVDIYGFCALSMFSELMELGDMESISVPYYHRPSCDDDEEFYLQDEDDVEPWNDLSPTAKLEYALLMAEAVAVLNNYENGVIVHDDIQPAQFLPTKDGLKFNDFNRAEIMLYDEENQEYCQYRNGDAFGDWRAPEEYRNNEMYLDEKIDVFSRNNFYSLLTGLFVFYDECDEANLQRRVVEGEWPYIDERWLNHSFAEGRLVEIMQQCWTYEAEERIDIGTLVQLLRNAVQENRQYQDQDNVKHTAAMEAHHHHHHKHNHGLDQDSYHHVHHKTQQQQQQGQGQTGT